MKYVQSILILCLSCIVLIFGCKKKEETTTPPLITITQNITTPTTWYASNVYTIDGEIYIDADLTIEPGTTIKFTSNGAIYFGYINYMTLTANGTTDKPILFTSAATSKTTGTWIGLWFYNHVQTNSSMSYCTIEYAGTYSTAAVGFHGTKINMNNCTIRNAKTTGISSDSDQQGFVSFNNNTISNCGSHAIVIKANALQTLGSNNTISCSSGYGIKVDGGSFNQNTATIWRKMSVPYYIASTVNIDGQLTIEPGTIIKFETNSLFKIGFSHNTTFTATGTATNKIIFTSSASGKKTGDWKGLWFYSHTLGTSKLNYCDISYGGAPGDTADANIKIMDATDMTISNCDISYSKGWGIYLDNSSLSDSSINNTFTGTNVLGNIGP